MVLHTNCGVFTKISPRKFPLCQSEAEGKDGESQGGRMDESCNPTLNVTKKISVCGIVLTDLSMISSSEYECICSGLLPEEERGV